MYHSLTSEGTFVVYIVHLMCSDGYIKIVCLLKSDTHKTILHVKLQSLKGNGHNLNKLGRGPLGVAIQQISRR